MDKTFYHTFLIYKIRQTCREDIVDLSMIKEIIGRTSIRHAGLPRNMIRFIVQDLIDLKLISKINNEKYRILNTPLERRIKALMLATC